MTTMDIEALKEILRKAEIKRVGERLSKKEICNIYKFNYNFYMNCVSTRNTPSQNMGESLSEYLKTPTDKVYKMVFASRDKEDKYHENLSISEEEALALLDKLAKDKLYEEPVL